MENNKTHESIIFQIQCESSAEKNQLFNNVRNISANSLNTFMGLLKGVRGMQNKEPIIDITKIALKTLRSVVMLGAELLVMGSYLIQRAEYMLPSDEKPLNQLPLNQLPSNPLPSPPVETETSEPDEKPLETYVPKKEENKNRSIKLGLLTGPMQSLKK